MEEMLSFDLVFPQIVLAVIDSGCNQIPNSRKIMLYTVYSGS
jgi:hypothetical protein